MQEFLNWLLLDFEIYGIHIQHWVMMVAGTFAILIYANWQDHRSARK